MDLRRFLVIGLVLVFVAAPGAALLCEAGCARSDSPLTDAVENAEDCHRAAHDESGFGPRLVGSHDCSQHAAVATVSLKTESNRAASFQRVALLTIYIVHGVDFSSAREAISAHDLAPPGPASRLIAPLRI